MYKDVQEGDVLLKGLCTSKECIVAKGIFQQRSSL